MRSAVLRGRPLALCVPAGLAAWIAVAAVVAGCGDDDDVAAGVTDAAKDTATSPPADASPPIDAARPDAGSDAGRDASEAGAVDAEAGPPPPPPPIVGFRDRAGRPWVSIVLVGDANREDYNATELDLASPAGPVKDGSTFGADFQSRLALLDALDGADDWAGGPADAGPDDAGAYPHELATDWIVADALVVDPNKPFDAASYLDVEANGDAHLTCGGRWFGDDTLDKTMSWLVRRSLDGVSDRVAAPARAPALTFPYLAAPF